jgi:hypothetical protein
VGKVDRETIGTGKVIKLERRETGNRGTVELIRPERKRTVFRVDTVIQGDYCLGGGGGKTQSKVLALRQCNCFRVFVGRKKLNPKYIVYTKLVLLSS